MIWVLMIFISEAKKLMIYKSYYLILFIMKNLEITKLCLTINLDNLPINIEFKDGEKSPHVGFIPLFINQVVINNNKRKNDNIDIIPLISQKRVKNGPT